MAAAVRAAGEAFPAVGGAPSARTRSDAVQGRRSPRRAVRTTGGRDDEGGREDPLRSARRGPPIDQHPPLLRRRGRAAAGPARAVRAGSRLRVCAPQAAGRCRTGHAVELPERHSRLEARARPRCWEHGCAQTRVRRSAEQLENRRGAGRGGRAAGRRELRGGAGRGPRRGDGRWPRDACRFVHGIVRDRRAALRPRGAATAAHPARDGRQEPDRRPRRRGPGPGSVRHRQRRICLDRPEVHGHEPRDCRGRGARRLRRTAGRAHAGAEGGQRDGGRHRCRPRHRSRTTRYRAGLRRAREARRRDAAVRGPTPRPSRRSTSGSSSSRPSSRASASGCRLPRRRSSGRCWRS